MLRIAILLLTACLFSGCAISEMSREGAQRGAFWGRQIENDGSEHFRMGDMLIKTRGAHSR
jgi:hypothetical protein